jgi:hypothetical protein
MKPHLLLILALLALPLASHADEAPAAAPSFLQAGKTYQITVLDESLKTCARCHWTCPEMAVSNLRSR